jgi:hypothetical protein
MIRNAAAHVERSAPVDLIAFPPDSAERFVSSRGRIKVAHRDLEWIRLE